MSLNRFKQLCHVTHFSYLCRTDPKDVARVESKTVIASKEKYKTVPHVRDGVKGIIGSWMSVEDLNKEMDQRFPGCMAGNNSVEWKN